VVLPDGVDSTTPILFNNSIVISILDGASQTEYSSLIPHDLSATSAITTSAIITLNQNCTL